MSYSIQVFAGTTPEVEQLRAFCETRGILLNQSYEITVELKELPEALLELKRVGYKDAQENKWMIDRISDVGITLLINNIAPDASIPQTTIFIPKENIICIHSLFGNFVSDL